jgi:Carboxypeptidase regulatory-like domain
MRHALKKQLSLTVIISFIIAMLPLAVPAQDNLGLVRGFVYSDDGKKPLSDAVVLIRETTTEKTYKSELTKKNGAYKIEKLLPGTYTVGIQYKGKDYNVDVLLQIRPKKQLACFTLPKAMENPGYVVRCKSIKCFFITPIGWALVAGATAGIVYGIVKVTERAVSATTPTI